MSLHGESQHKGIQGLSSPFSTLPSISRPWHAAPLISSLINRTAHRPKLHQPHHLPSSQEGDETHDSEGRFQPDQFPELPPTKSHTGTTKDASLWQFKLICISAAVFSLFSFPPALHSHISLWSAGICLTWQPASSGSYTSRKLFYSLQKMFSARTAPLNWLLVGRWSVSPSVFLLP